MENSQEKWVTHTRDLTRADIDKISELVSAESFNYQIIGDVDEGSEGYKMKLTATNSAWHTISTWLMAHKTPPPDQVPPAWDI